MRFTSLLTAALLAAPVLASASESTQGNMAWEGRYGGLLPCASCAGIETTLTLAEDGSFKLSEVYQTEDRESFMNEGNFTWDEVGEIVTLPTDPVKRLQIEEDSATFLLDDGTPAGDLYTLAKFDEFNSNGEQLFINPTEIAGDGKETLTFPALINVTNSETSDQYRSSTSIVTLNCTSKTAMLAERTMFTDFDANGTETSQQDVEVLLSEGDDVLTQVAQAYCS